MQALDRLIEPDRVHRSIYTDLAIFEREMTHIFEKTWIYVGHESQVPKAGDYYATTIGRQPVVLVRHRDGTTRVLFNRCAHKGAQLVGNECGNVQAFRCAYHGWRYDTDGTLQTIPLAEGYDGTGFCRDASANMQPVPRSGVYRGFVFASLSATGPALEDWLGGIASSIDNMVDRSPEGELVVAGGVLRHELDCNWKFHVENLNDMLHPMVAHQSSSQTARIVAAGSGDAPVPAAIEIIAPFTNRYSFWDEVGLHAFPHGHSYSGGRVSIHSAYSGIAAYDEAMKAAYGDARAQEILSVSRHNSVIYPTLTLKGAIQTLRVARPIAVDKTIIESWSFRLKGAPDEVFRRSILYSTLINSSFGLVQPDDHEAYLRLQRGLLASGSDWVSMHRHAGRDVPEAGGGSSSLGTSDMVFRNQYQTWLGLMQGDAP